MSKGVIDFDALRKRVVEETGLTQQQRWWNRRREKLRAMQPQSVRVPVGQRKKHPCTCTPVKHARKHHKKTGHCRPGCDCKAGIRE